MELSAAKPIIFNETPTGRGGQISTVPKPEHRLFSQLFKKTILEGVGTVTPRNLKYYHFIGGL